MVLPICTLCGVALPSWASPLSLAWFVWVFAPLVSFLRCFSLGCLHLWCGLGALTFRRHGVVCSRWALGVHGVLSCWAAAAAAVASPSLCAVYFFVGSSDQSSHTSDNGGGVFCQSAIDTEDAPMLFNPCWRTKRTQLRWWVPGCPNDPPGFNSTMFFVVLHTIQYQLNQIYCFNVVCIYLYAAIDFFRNGINVKCFFPAGMWWQLCEQTRETLFYPMQQYFEDGEEWNLAPTITQLDWNNFHCGMAEHIQNKNCA